MSSESNNSQDWRVDYLLLAALWGSSFLFMRMGASEFGPLATAWTRVFVATLFLAPLMLQQGHWPVFKKHWKLVLGFGVFNSALPFALFAYAVLHISTGLSAILNASCSDILRSITSNNLWFGITIKVSTYSLRRSIPSSACVDGIDQLEIALHPGIALPEATVLA